jgi:hypothetical protein
MRLLDRFRLFKEKPDVISPKAVWVLFDYHLSVYMYTGETLWDLFQDCRKHWRSDKMRVM